MKVYETRACLDSGAREIDMVVPIGLLRAGDFAAVQDDIQAVAEATHAYGGLLKVILEMALLDRQAKIAGCLLAKASGADFVKTSTGFGPGGATAADIELMRRVVVTGVKARGRSLADARRCAGCRSDPPEAARVKIMHELEVEN
jgi:deoxyribose-phosphate aldolase